MWTFVKTGKCVGFILDLSIRINTYAGMRDKEGTLYILAAFKMRWILIFNRTKDKFGG